MKTLKAILEQSSDGTWNAYLENEMFSGMGATQQAAKQDMIDSIKFYVDGCKADNYKYPEWLDGDYEIVYRYDTQSILKILRGVITKAAIARRSGINQKQLGDYESGRSKPRPATARKIEDAFHSLGDELRSISISE